MRTRRSHRINRVVEQLECRVAPAFAAVGPEFRINTTTLNAQRSPKLAMDADGDFVAVWVGQSAALDDEIFAQRYSSNGSPLGSEFRVNTQTTGNQTEPAVGMSASGDFVVTWTTDLQDGGGNSVVAQRFDSAGMALGGEFQVNVFTTGVQLLPAVALNAAGDFVITWSSVGQDGSASGVYARRFASTGAPLSGEFRVNTTTTAGQGISDVAMNARGEFAIAWQSNLQDGDSYGVYLRRYDAAGSPLGGETAVNTFTTGFQGGPAVAMDAEGDLVVVWQSGGGQDGSSNGVYGKRFAATGAAASAEFRVNTFTTNFQTSPALAVDVDGDFVVVWESTNQDGDNNGIYAQRYLADGTTLGSEFRVNTFTTDLQGAVSVAVDADGDFAVAWASVNQDGSFAGVYGQRYSDLDNNGDLANPFVAAVTPAGEFGPLRNGDRLNQAVTSLLVVFSEDMSATGGAVGANSVLNPANYGLSRNGVALIAPITGIGYGYNPATNRFEAVLSLNTPLTDGLYQFTARTTLMDLTENRLDGRINGSGFGTDAALEFSIAGSPPAEPEYRVNTFTSGSQLFPKIAADADGNFVAVWQSEAQDGNQHGVYAQRYNADGVPLGPEFRVNMATNDTQRDPDVAMSAAGDFVVAWISGSQDGSGFGVYAQRYSAAGIPLSVEFRVNSFTTGNQRSPAIAMNADGDSVIAWSSFGQDGAGYGIYAQRYSAAGVPLGNEFRVNTFTAGDQLSPAIALDAAGSSVITWSSDNQDGSVFGVYAQRYSATGLAIGSEFRVNTFTIGNQLGPKVAVSAGGGFVVAWTSGGQDGSSDGVYSRGYSANGTPLGTELQVNTFTTGAQGSPSVAMDDDGDYVVCWGGYDQDGSGAGVFARRFRFDGVAQGGDFLVNTFTSSTQANPGIAMDADGDFVAVWASDAQDGSSFGIFAQRFRRLLSVNSVTLPATGSAIANGGVAVAPITQLAVDLAGNPAIAGPGSITNVANWQLSLYGTAVPAAISEVTFGGSQAIVGFTTPLNDGRFTLTALQSILDVDGRALDGNSDGVPGDAFAITFDVKLVTPIGDESRVNTFLTGQQTVPAIASDAQGNYVVAWQSNGQDGDLNGIYAQRFAANGTPLGAEFRVNTFTTGSQLQPAVGMSANGQFVIAWHSQNQDGAGFGVYAQRFTAGGVGVGGEFRVSNVTIGDQRESAIAVDDSGDFVIAWQDSLLDGSGSGIFVRRYTADGVSLGAPSQINQFTTGNQVTPTVALDADGDFVVVWASIGQDGANYGVYARRYAATGGALANEFRVNQFTTGNQNLPTIGMNSVGDFVIAWQDGAQDGNGYGVYARLYNAVGIAQSAEFRVNSFTSNDQRGPSIGVDADGDFVVTWQSNLQDGALGGIYGQRYSAAGLTQGGEFRANTVTTESQATGAVASNAVGDFIVVWQSDLQDGSNYGIYARRYQANLTPTTNGLPNINIPPSPATNVNLAAGFDDIEDGAAGLTYSLAGNSNSFLFSSIVVVGSTMTLTPVGSNGSAQLTIRATDAGGSFVQMIFTVNVVVAPPTVTQVVVNGGATQRSRVTELTVTFSAQVTFATTPRGSFSLARSGGGFIGDFTAVANVVGGVTVVTINGFTGAETNFGSLADGRWTLTASAGRITAGGVALDGDNNGTPGGDFTFGDAQGLFRFYADMTGDRRVDISDFGFFSLAYLTPANFSAALDFNNDGRIDIADFGQFSIRYFTTLP